MTTNAARDFDIGMSADSAEQVNQKLAEYAAKFHLVSPATSCGYLPPGCMVQFSFVKVDPDPKNKEVYPIQGSSDLGLGKNALNRIGAAASIKWPPSQFAPRDPEAPNRCACTVTALWQHFDGSPMPLSAYYEEDLGDGSAAYDLMYTRYEIAMERWEKGGKRDREPSHPKMELLKKRHDLALNCETKARNRLIRTIGLKTSYSPKELEKAFAVARLHNPAEAAALFERAMDAMFGQDRPRLAEPRRVYALPSAEPQSRPTTFDTDGVVQEPPKSEPRPVERKPDPPTPPPAQTQRQASPPPPANDDDEPAVPFGKNKGIPLCELNEKQVNAYVEMLTANVADASKARWRSQNEEHLAMFEREVARRNGGTPAAPPKSPVGDDDLPPEDSDLPF